MVPLPLHLRELLRPRNCHGEGLYPPLLRAHFPLAKRLVPPITLRNGRYCLPLVDHLPIRRHLRMHTDPLFLGAEACHGTLHQHSVILPGASHSEYHHGWDIAGPAVAHDLGPASTEGAEDGAEWGVFAGELVRVHPKRRITGLGTAC